jgi:hypothetical protein
MMRCGAREGLVKGSEYAGAMLGLAIRVRTTPRPPTQPQLAPPQLDPPHLAPPQLARLLRIRACTSHKGGVEA